MDDEPVKLVAAVVVLCIVVPLFIYGILYYPLNTIAAMSVFIWCSGMNSKFNGQ